MSPIDHAILQHCKEDFQPMTPLKGQIPSGTLYRHVGRLVALGWLDKQGRLYRTTPAGRRQLDAATSARSWATLEIAYPPLALVPTPTHRAAIELIFAAAVARRHETRPDRHPCFVAFGSTLHWKTSLGIFVCHALGLDPALHIVDCGTETGKSVAIRRGGTGAAVFERLLQAPFVTFDEFLTASPEVRAALALFLGGRVVVAFENEQLTVHPVSLLTLNPRAKPTLEQQIGLSAPQVRRAILVNLDTVSMPDLAVTGERALEAARAHPPLELGAPAVDCGTFHDRVVDLARAILVPEAHARVDVEIVVNLTTGMTAFIADPAEAIAQVGYDLGLLAEALGWTRAGWIQTVTDFSLTPGKDASVIASSSAAPRTAVAKTEGNPAAGAEPTSLETLSLAVPEPVRRKRHVPDIALSEATLMRLVWFAHETGQDTDGAIDLLLDFYLEWRGDEKAIETIEAILGLAKELQMAEIEVETLQDYLADRQALATHHCGFADLPDALRVLELLSQLPTEWDWERATTAMQAVADLLREGLSVEEIGEFIARYQRLEALGFTDTAEALARILCAAGAVGDQQDAIIRHLVEPARALADHEKLEAISARLHAEVAQLEARKAQLESALGALEGRWDGLCRDVQAGQAALAEVKAERAMKAGDLDVLQALRSFLRGKTAAVEAFFEDLRKLDRWRRVGGTLDDWVGATYLKGLSEKLVAFFQQLLQEAQGKS